MKSEQWYNWQTALKLIQGCGRSIRSEDWAEPGTFVMKSNNILQDWFTQALLAGELDVERSQPVYLPTSGVQLRHNEVEEMFHKSVNLA